MDGNLDQGIDVMVEVATGGAGTGFHFAVQSKATAATAMLTKDGVGVPLKRRNAAYLASQQLPVFLMFVDIKSKRIYWTDAKADLEKAPRRQDGTVYLKVPREHCIEIDANDEELDRYREAFIIALRASQQHGSLPPMEQVRRSIQTYERELNELDERLGVRVSADGSGERYEITLAEEIPLKARMQFSSLADGQKLRDAIDFAKSTTVRLEEFNLEGSALFDRLLPRSTPGSLTVSPIPVPARIYLGVPRDDSPSHARLENVLVLPGEQFKGLRGGRIVAESSDQPVGIEVSWGTDSLRMNVTIGTDVDGWAGRRLYLQSALSDAAATLNAIATSGRLAVAKDNRSLLGAITASLTSELCETLRTASIALEELDDLREISTRYGLDLLIRKSSDYFRSEPIWWRIGRRVLDGEVAEAPATTLTLRGDFDADGLALISTQPNGVLVVKNVPLVIYACGEEVCTIPIDASATSFTPEFSLVDGVGQLRLLSNSASTLRLRRHSDELFE